MYRVDMILVAKAENLAKTIAEPTQNDNHYARAVVLNVM